MRYSTVPRHVYVHVPFCARRCSYCDFSIAVRREVPVDEYLAALDGELRSRFGESGATEVDTIYFGGGTPSRLGGDGLARALALVERHFPRVRGAEITAEANPEDVSEETAAVWRAAGFNRLSLGSQTFHDSVLRWMHRTHDALTIGDSVRAARSAGFDNVSLDLIFALPESLGRNFEHDIEELLALRPEHVSLYGLTVEPATPVGRWVERGISVEQPEDGYAWDFLTAHRLLGAAGFEHYEVSNYGLPGRRARHNSAYWSGASYVGLGPAAHGFDGEVRRWNVRAYAAWRDVAAAGTDPVEDRESLTSANRTAESVYLGLRTNGGLQLDEEERTIVSSWVAAGWMTVDPRGRARCTPEGWLRLDALAASLTHHRSR